MSVNWEELCQPVLVKKIVKKAKKGMRGYPIATIAFYGPTNSMASKVVCSIFLHENSEPEPMKKWLTDKDARKSEDVFNELNAFMDENKVMTVSMIDKILGCPHEEGIDYSEGESCPTCLYWKNRDRLTDEIIN